jgi:hypothetical protein
MYIVPGYSNSGTALAAFLKKDGMIAGQAPESFQLLYVDCGKHCGLLLSIPQKIPDFLSCQNLFPSDIRYNS